MKFNAFGRHISVARAGDAWNVFDIASEGKRRSATDIPVPASLGDDEIPGDVSDLLHEYASDRRPVVDAIREDPAAADRARSCATRGSRRG